MQKKIFLSMIVLITIVMVLTPVWADSPKPGSKIVVGLKTFGQQYWPGAMVEWKTGGCLDGVYENLLYTTPEDTLTPCLAKSWERSNDGLVYTFYLQEGVQFHDGWGEMTAEDAKFSIELGLEPESVNARASYFRKNIDRVEVVDKYTLKVYMKSADWMLPGNLNEDEYVPIVSKKYWDKVGRQKAGSHPVGTGPYRFAEHKLDDYIRLEAIKNHWRKTPEAETIILKRIPEDATAVSMLKTGELDSAMVEIPFLREVRNIPNVKIKTAATVSAPLFLLGQYKPDTPGFDPTCPWADHLDEPRDSEWNQRALKVRKALELAIDKKIIVDKVLDGVGEMNPITNFYDWDVGWNPKWTPYPDYMTKSDPGLAKNLLAQAGYKPSDIKVKVMLTTGRNPIVMDIGQAVGAFWERLGIDVTYQTLDYGTMKSDYSIPRKGSGMAWVCPCAPGTLEPISQMYLYLGDARLGWGFEDPEFQVMMDKIMNTLDDQKREQLHLEMGQWLYDTRKMIETCKFGDIKVLGPKIKDWPMHPRATLPAQFLEFVELN